MKLTKTQLKQLIKEEMGLVLQEQRRRKQKCFNNSPLWIYLQNLSRADRSRNTQKALQVWKELLEKPNYCAPLEEVRSAPEDLVTIVLDYWNTLAKNSGCQKDPSPDCIALMTAVHEERALRKKMRRVTGTRGLGLQLEYLKKYYYKGGAIRYDPPDALPKKQPKVPAKKIPCDKADPMKLKSVGTYEKLNRKEAIAEYYAKTNEDGLSKERFERMLDVIKSKSTINRWEAVANDVCKWTYKYDRMIAKARRKKGPPK